jgi:L-ascorbate metabolism protein UlaG (beta-lactamase superfamily)
VAVAARRQKVGTLLMHMGRAAYGPLRFTMDAREGVLAARTFGEATVVPVHYDGWTHFHESRQEAERVLEGAGLGARVRWLVPGERTLVDD